MTFSERAVEAAARKIAFWEGQKFARPGESVASREMGWKPEGIHLEEYTDKHWQKYADHARAALTAALAVDGLALVPKEPTQAMIDAGTRETTPTPQSDPWYGHIDLSDSQAEQCYRAMLTAASDGEVG